MSSEGSVPRNRKCGNCRFYEPAPLWRKGWCRNPKLYPPHANHLVDAATIDCEGGFRSRIYWEPITASQPQVQPQPKAPAPQPPVAGTRQPTNPITPGPIGSYKPGSQPSFDTPASYQNAPVAPTPSQTDTRAPLINRFRRTQQEIDDIEARARAEAETELRRVDYRTPPSSYEARPSENDTQPFNTNDYRSRLEPETRPYPTPAVGNYQPPVVEPPASASFSNYTEAETESYGNYAPSQPTEQAGWQYHVPQNEPVAEAQYKFLDSHPTEPAPRTPPKVIVRPDRNQAPPLDPPGRYVSAQRPVGQGQPQAGERSQFDFGKFVQQVQQKLAALPPVRLGSRTFSGQQVLFGVLGVFVLLIILLMLLNGGNKNQNQPVAGTATTTAGSLVSTTATGVFSTTAVTTAPAVTTPAATTPAATTKAAERTALVSGNGDTPLNVRDTPAIKGKVVTTVKEGEKVTILEGPQEADGRVWYKVDYKGKVGWAVKDYLKL